MTNETIAVELPLEALDRFGRGMEEVRRSAGGVSSALSRGLKAAVVDGRALDQVLRQAALAFSTRMLDRALAPLERLAAFALDGLFSGLVSGGAGAFSSVLSSTFGGGRITPFAKGGVIAAPSYFPLGSGTTGLIGEAGAEAVLPLRRGADGRLGVAAATGTDQPPIVINITTRDAESFRHSEAQIAAMVARAAGRGRRGL